MVGRVFSTQEEFDDEIILILRLDFWKGGGVSFFRRKLRKLISSPNLGQVYMQTSAGARRSAKSAGLSVKFVGGFPQ